MTRQLGMTGGFYHRKRLYHFLISLIVFILLPVFNKSSIIPTIIFAAIGFSFGYVAAVADWRRTESRVDHRNHLILYRTDSFFYSVLVLLFLISQAPGFILKLPLMHRLPQNVFPLFLFLFVSSWNSYNLFFYIKVREYEITHGKIITRSFYSRSTMGREGLIGKHGQAMSDCNPTGTIEIDNEFWNAKSIGNEVIATGQRVIIRDVEGLTAIIEPLAKDTDNPRNRRTD